MVLFRKRYCPFFGVLTCQIIRKNFVLRSCCYLSTWPNFRFLPSKPVCLVSPVRRRRLRSASRRTEPTSPGSPPPPPRATLSSTACTWPSSLPRQVLRFVSPQHLVMKVAWIAWNDKLGNIKTTHTCKTSYPTHGCVIQSKNVSVNDVVYVNTSCLEK